MFIGNFQEFGLKNLLTKLGVTSDVIKISSMLCIIILHVSTVFGSIFLNCRLRELGFNLSTLDKLPQPSRSRQVKAF